MNVPFPCFGFGLWKHPVTDIEQHDNCDKHTDAFKNFLSDAALSTGNSAEQKGQQNTYQDTAQRTDIYRHDIFLFSRFYKIGDNSSDNEDCFQTFTEYQYKTGNKRCNNCRLSGICSLAAAFVQRAVKLGCIMVKHCNKLIFMRFYHLVVFIAVYISTIFIKRIFNRCFAGTGKVPHRYLFHPFRFIKPKVGNVHFVIRFFGFSLSIKIVSIIEMHFHLFYNSCPRIQHLFVICGIQSANRNKYER